MITRAAPFGMLAAAASVALGACGGPDPAPTDRPTSSSPTSESSPTSTVTVTSTPEIETLDAPEQQELTRKQIIAALPADGEAPEGFELARKDVDVAADGSSDTDPPACLAATFGTPEVRSWTTKHRTEGSGVRHEHRGGGNPTPSLVVSVWTHDRPYPTRFLDDAGAAMAQCASYEDNGTEWRTHHIANPVIGDRSFAVRRSSTAINLTIDDLWVRSGHNLINVRLASGPGPDSSDTLEKHAQGVLDDLKKATS